MTVSRASLTHLIAVAHRVNSDRNVPASVYRRRLATLRDAVDQVYGELHLAEGALRRRVRAADMSPHERAAYERDYVPGTPTSNLAKPHQIVEFRNGQCIGLILGAVMSDGTFEALDR